MQCWRCKKLKSYEVLLKNLTIFECVFKLKSSKERNSELCNNDACSATMYNVT